MKNLFTVIKFTIKDLVRKKAFIISTIAILAIIVAGFNIPKLIGSNNEKEKVLISDTNNIFEGTLNAISSMPELENYDIKIENSTFEDIKQKIENEEIKSAVIIEKDGNKIKLRYIVENSRWSEGIPQDLLRTLNSMYSNNQIGKLGLTAEELSMINPEYEVSIEQTQKDEVNQGNVFVMMIISFMLSMAIIIFTAQVSISITTEKTSKIIETLVTSTSPRTIVIGKTIGIGIIGLLQIMLFAATAFICAKSFLDPQLLNTILDMSNFTPYFVIITIIYFILGFFTYAFLYALTGSLVSKPEDIQSANMPVSFIVMIGFYLGYLSISIDPTSGLNGFASLCPISSPFCMPSRIAMGLASGTDVAISIALLVVTVLVIAKIAVKVYSNAILNYGSKMSLKDAIKLYKDK